MTAFLRWVVRARPFPYPRETAYSAMALLFMVGGFTILLILLLPHPTSLPGPFVALIALGSPVVGVSIHALRHRLPSALLPWLVAGTTLLTTVLVATGGSASATVSFSFFYLWIAVYSVLFFSPLLIASELTLAALAYAVAVAWVRPTSTEDFTGLEPLLLASVIGTTCVVVLMLTRARELSEVDPLTRALNRRGLERFLSAALKGGAPANHDVVVAMLDIDYFKKVNDTCGHDAGDRLLYGLAESWRDVLRPEDSLSRFGGDEFVVVLPGCTEADAAAIVERLRSASPEGITCSAGVAVWRPGETDSALLKRADAALYDAKRLGRDRTEWGSRPGQEERRRSRS